MSDVLIDSYSETNKNSSYPLSKTIFYQAAGQSFAPLDALLTSVKFYLKKDSSPVGNLYAKLYAHTGTFGSLGKPTGAALAISDAVNISSLDSSFGLIEFSFTGINQYLLVNGTKYFIIVDSTSAGSSTDGSEIGIDTVGAHEGNLAYYQSGTWTAISGADTCFYIYGILFPDVTTLAESGISYTSAIANGNVTTAGGSTIDQRGIVYSTSTQSDPGNLSPGSSGYSSYIEESGSFSTGTFTESITGLIPNTTYYVRAYAHNSLGYSYGSEVSFTTLANTFSSITTEEVSQTTPFGNAYYPFAYPIAYQAYSVLSGLTAKAYATITDTGNQMPDIRGFVYDTSSHSDPGNVAPASSSYGSNTSQNGSFGLGEFTNNITGLSLSTTYYIRAYTHNASGYSYGNEQSFRTLSAPTVTTSAVTNNTSLTTATGNGNVTSGGDSTVTERGVVINTTGTPTTSDTKFSTSGTTGSYSVSMTSLVPGTLYYVRAYAINSVGTSYGSQTSFTAANFLNPTNVYSDDGSFCTAGGDSGVITLQLSPDGGTTWSSTLSKTFNGTNGALTYGAGSAELWGLGWLGSMVTDSNFRIRVSCGTRPSTHIWETFGFAPGSSVVLTGIEVVVKAKWITDTTSIDNIKVKIYYGSSVLPVQAGSQQYATNGGLAGTGALEVYNGTAWKALADTDTANVTGQSVSVDNEVALFSGTSGKSIKRATATGLAKLASGVLSAAAAGTDYYAPGSTDVAIADGGTGQSTKAAGFDALSPMSASGDIIYGGTSGTGTRLPKGSDSQVLTLASGLPSWVNPPTSQFLTFTPAGSTDGTGTSYTDWITIGTASIPTWCTKINITVTMNAIFPLTATNNMNFRIKIGSDTGTGIPGYNTSIPVNQTLCISWCDSLTPSATGSKSVIIQQIRTGGSNGVRAGTGSGFTILLFYS